MNHDPEYHDRVERLIELELKRLPQPPVPELLLGRVLSAIQAEQRKPWWQKPWSCWPCLIQVFFIASLLALAGSLVYGISLASTDAPSQWISAKVAGIYHEVSTSASVVMAVVNALLLVLTSAFKNWMLIAIAAATILYASSVALGVAWFRVVLSRRSFDFKLL